VIQLSRMIDYTAQNRLWSSHCSSQVKM